MACGARVGFLFTKNKNVFSSIERLAKLRLSPPHFGERLAIHMLENDETYLAKTKAEYDKRRKIIYERLSKIPGVTCYLPDGAFYCFARFPVEDSEDFCRWLLESYRLNNRTVMLSPGSGFYQTPGLGADEVRIAFVLEEKKLARAMDIIESAIAVYPKKLKEIVI
jgi:aspartate aminotransferase